MKTKLVLFKTLLSIYYLAPFGLEPASKQRLPLRHQRHERTSIAGAVSS